MGSTYNMYLILKTLGVPTEMYIDCQMTHGLDNNCDYKHNPGCFKSEFGTHTNTTTDVQVYMVQRACVFFQDIINNVNTTGRTTLFVECENTRDKCDSAYTGCAGSSCD